MQQQGCMDSHQSKTFSLQTLDSAAAASREFQHCHSRLGQPENSLQAQIKDGRPNHGSKGRVKTFDLTIKYCFSMLVVNNAQ